MPPKDIPIKLPTATSAAPTPQNAFVPSTLAALGHPDVPVTITEGDGEPIAVQGISKAFVQRRVEGLKGVHVEFTKLKARYRRELYELKLKYMELYAPIFERRAAIIAGVSEPTAYEVSAGEALTLEDDPDAEPLPEVNADGGKADDDIKGVPQFWLHALKNHREVAPFITERDEEALAYLQDICVKFLPSSTPGYILSFYFAPNEFFTNKVLTNTYVYQDIVGELGDYAYSSVEGTTIDWKEEKDLTKTHESFFDFFSPAAPLSVDQMESHGMTEEQLEEHEERVDLDYQFGEELKDRIIARAIHFFTSKVI
ncbi:hypothetical protein FRB90_005492 [Tulasnella sp. 427]|nr:hypothetical protein FRB90_005492 [Tulasnella sp. 427]